MPWAQNVSPEGRARSEAKVLKLPLAVQVLGVVLGWQSWVPWNVPMDCSPWQHHCVCGALQQSRNPARLWKMG